MPYLDPAAGGAREGGSGELPTMLTAIPIAAIADMVAITGGEVPTEAEHNLIITKINAILAGLRTGKIVTP